MKQMLCSEGRTVWWGNTLLQGKDGIRIVGAAGFFDSSSMVLLYTWQTGAGNSHTMPVSSLYIFLIEIHISFILYSSPPSHPQPLYFSPILRMCWSWPVAETVVAVTFSGLVPILPFQTHLLPFTHCASTVSMSPSQQAAPHSWILCMLWWHLLYPKNIPDWLPSTHPRPSSVVNSSVKYSQFLLTRRGSESEICLKNPVLPLTMGITPAHVMKPVFSFVKQAY